ASRCNCRSRASSSSRTAPSHACQVRCSSVSSQRASAMPPMIPKYLNPQTSRGRVTLESSTTWESAMPVQRLNHAVLYVRDVDRSVRFYRDTLGFRTVNEIPGRAAFLQAAGSTNDHDLGLFAIGT